MRRRRLFSITRAPRRKGTGPTFTGGVVGGESNLVILDAGDVLDDAFPLSSLRSTLFGDVFAAFQE